MSTHTGKPANQAVPHRPHDPKQPLPKAPDEPPEQLTEEELRLMADTMPGDGPGDD